MSSVRSGDKVYPNALLVSDLHIRATTPVARRELDWKAVMQRYLMQLHTLHTELISQNDGLAVPVIYAGDIFDKWNTPAEIINFAIKWLPKGYAIPGQHDLPNHRYDLITKSAYWTLCEAGVLKNLSPIEPIQLDNGWFVHAFPWGYELKPHVAGFRPMYKHLAVVHSYIWKDYETCYHGAPEEYKVSSYKKALKGYDAAVFGDNHKGFLVKTLQGQHILNHGGFMCFKSDERNYKPHVGVLYSDGSIKQFPLNTSEDQWHEEKEVKGLEEAHETAKDFLEELAKLGDKAIDFARVLRTKAGELPPEEFRVRDLLLKALESKE